MSKLLLLGSGELGKEICISAKRLGCTVVACDSYPDAPAMQVADANYVFDMLDSDKLKDVINLTNPDYIVPEIEAIRTEELLAQELLGKVVVPNAKAVNLTMNRDKIRDHASSLGLKTARYDYANTELELEKAVENIGFPCIVKPVMSSSGKGQSMIHEEKEIHAAWITAVKGMRGDRQKVMIEQFLDFDYEITLLTIRQNNGPTLFCQSIGHVQQDGDYRWSWQPAHIAPKTGSHPIEQEARRLAKIITDDLGGAGLFGVEFFVLNEEVIFSELSPRPHDTGMVTLYTQAQSEFDLHVRAILGLPIPSIKLIRPGASHVILAEHDSDDFKISGLNEALAEPDVDVRIFGKRQARPNRRMGVILAPNVDKAKQAASKIEIKPSI